MYMAIKTSIYIHHSVRFVKEPFYIYFNTHLSSHPATGCNIVMTREPAFLFSVGPSEDLTPDLQREAALLTEYPPRLAHMGWLTVTGKFVD